MADKEYLLGNRARELLKYTKRATRIVSDDISRSDVRRLIKKIADLDDIRDVKAVCAEVIHVLDTKDREGFTKSNFDMYGKDMREVAKGIVLSVHSANDKLFATEHQERLKEINHLLDGCSLLLEYVQICLEENIISTKKAGVWTAKIQDVKRMAGSWKKNDGARARKLVAEQQAVSDRRQYDLTKAACREVMGQR